MSEYQTFIEIEEGCLTMTLAERHRGRFASLVHESTSLPSLERSDVVDALKRILSNVPSKVEGAHVALGERRSIHFLSKVPMLAPHQMMAFVDREAHRLGSLAPDVNVLSASRYIAPLKNNIHLFGAVALPAHVWEPIGRAFAELGIEVLSLTSVEDAISAVLPEDFATPAAVLEVSAGRVRFVYCERGSVSQVRRFLLPGGEDALEDPSMVAAQLAMEVPRTMDYLCDQNCEAVASLLISHRLGLDMTLAPMVAGDVDDFKVFRPEEASDVDQCPGLATIGMMRRALRGDVASLLKSEIARVPVGWTTKVLAAVGLVVGMGAVAGVLALEPSEREFAAKLRATDEQRAALEEARLAQQRAQAQRGLSSPEELRREELMLSRRPTSLMLASVANAAPDRLFIEELTMAPKRTIVVSGRVEGETRIESLHRIAAFSEALQQVECVRKVDEEVSRGAQDGTMSFTIQLDWRPL